MLYTIISGTNRPEGITHKVAQYYHQLLESEGVTVKTYYLKDLPANFLQDEMYGNRSESFQKEVDTYIAPAQKFIFIMPEYNGGFPGVLKTFIDAIHPEHFYHKKAALVGLSSGYLGCARGMDAFTNILNYLKIHVMAQKPKLSKIEDRLDAQNDLKDERSKAMLKEHARELIKF